MMTPKQKIKITMASNIAYNMKQTAMDEKSRHEFGRISSLLDDVLNSGKKTFLWFDEVGEIHEEDWEVLREGVKK